MRATGIAIIGSSGLFAWALAGCLAEPEEATDAPGAPVEEALGGVVASSPGEVTDLEEEVGEAPEEIVLGGPGGRFDPRWRPPFRACGGFTGAGCPRGQRCIDDPRDSCHPWRGADCIGICVGPGIGHPGFPPGGPPIGRPPIGRPPIGRPPIGRPPVGERCGPSVCGSGEYCCNPSCGICAPIGGSCIQIACD